MNSAQGRRQFLIAAIAAGAVGAALAVWFAPSRQQQTHARVALPEAAPRPGAMPVAYPTPQFAFPDQDDISVSTLSLRGKVWIADFIFTHCANTCPRMTDKRVELQKQIDDPRVMFLSFSVDPERDDRGTRKSYAADHHVDEARWKFVSPPDRDAALHLAQSMKVATGNHDGLSPILHSDRFILIDAHCRVRGTYALDDEEAMKRLVGDATTLAKDAPVVK